jgi:hypothetical protein
MDEARSSCSLCNTSSSSKDSKASSYDDSNTSNSSKGTKRGGGSLGMWLSEYLHRLETGVYRVEPYDMSAPKSTIPWFKHISLFPSPDLSPSPKETPETLSEPQGILGEIDEDCEDSSTSYRGGVSISNGEHLLHFFFLCEVAGCAMFDDEI